MPKKKLTSSQHKKARQAEMLKVFPEYGTVTHACRAVGISRRTHYDWLEADPDYAEKFKHAEAESTEELEQVAINRAKETSDTLLIFLLKGRKPHMYRDRQSIEHTGKDGGPLEVKGTVDAKTLSTETLRAILKETGKDG